MLYGAECWSTKRRHVQQLSIAEMRMLRWFCGHTKRERIRNEVIRVRVGVAPIEEKLTQHQLKWFGYIQRMPPEVPVRSGVLKRVDKVKRGRGRYKLTWEELAKKNLKDWNISKEITLDRSAWRLAINVPEPWTYFFRVSSLAYPNLLGKKGYVVVVVVVVVRMSWANINIIVLSRKHNACRTFRMWHLLHHYLLAHNRVIFVSFGISLRR